MCAALMSAGCGKTVNPAEVHDAEFRLTVTGVEGTTISATVASTGDKDDTYLCFCTEDLETDIMSLVGRKIEELGNGLTSQLASGNRMFNFDKLKPFTEYRVIVVGVLRDGSSYGVASSARAETLEGPVVYEENPAWNVTYSGRGLSSKGEPSDMISVTSTSDDRYFTFVYPLDGLEAEYESIDKFIEAMTAFIDATLASYAAMGIELTWEDVTYTKSVENEPNKLLLDDQTYVAFAIGVDTEGKNTGWYAMSGAFKPQLLPAGDDYTVWLGKWSVTGANGQTSTIDLSPHTSSLSFMMSGFAFDTTPPVIVAFDNATGELVFFARDAVGEWQTDHGKGQIGFYGGIPNPESGRLPVPVFGDGYEIARAKITAGNKTATITPGTINVENQGTATPLNMGYSVYLPGGAYVTYSENPTFPITMTYIETPKP